MAKKKKKSSSTKQTDFFVKEEKPKTRDGLPQKDVVLPKVLSREKMYNGMDIVELTEKIRKCVKDGGATYIPNNWNGTANIRMKESAYDVVFIMIKSIVEMAKKYSFGASVKVVVQSDDEFGFQYLLNILVPGILDTSGDPFSK